MASFPRPDNDRDVTAHHSNSFTDIIPNEPVQRSTPVTFTRAATTLDAVESELDQYLPYGDTTLADFLNDVMMPSANDPRPNADQGIPQSMQMDILDFNMDAWPMSTQPFPETDLFNLRPELPVPSVRFDLAYQTQGFSRSGCATPLTRERISLGTQAFQESLWSFVPSPADNWNAEQVNLTLPFEELVPRTKTQSPEPIYLGLTQTDRDRILTSIISTCETSLVPRIASSFPSADLFTNMIHSFFNHHLSQDDTWMHYPTFVQNSPRVELLIAIIAAGAARSPISMIRRLGHAFHEASREIIAKMFEIDNENIQRLQPLQAFALQLDVGLWSGNKRKLEIAEGFTYALITMLRRRGHFRQPIWPAAPPNASDDAVTTESKWHAWVKQESYKRLALHLLIRDAQTSLSLLTPPLISYAEVTVTMPCSRDLWLAKSSAEWRELYLKRHSSNPGCPPSLRSCIEDMHPILTFRNVIDAQMSMSTILSALWSLSWQYREWDSVFKPHAVEPRRNGAAMTNTVYPEILQLFQHFRLTTSEWTGVLEPAASILWERGLMNLHASLEDVQLLAGKAGEAEARRVLPRLSAWAQSRDCRHALWHAGQIFRAAKASPPRILQDSSAIAVYHASLIFWGYSIVSKSSSAVHQTPSYNASGQRRASLDARDILRLDMEETPQVQLFIVFGQGVPAISSNDTSKSSNHGSVLISDTRKVMVAFADLLRVKNHPGGADEDYPPLIENLTMLMKALGHAASGIKLGRADM
ncbi:hypothetical protein LTS15_009685 [Exophiala xenobiotica]|nr:hypothetical protein LTS15_009685 [Exophiala xenobiotica]